MWSCVPTARRWFRWSEPTATLVAQEERLGRDHDEQDTEEQKRDG